MEVDFLIIGAGPAGLSTAIRLRDLFIHEEYQPSIMVLEKGSQVGAHILSGNIFESQALDRLIPNWRDYDDHPLKCKVRDESTLYLTQNKSQEVPHNLVPHDAINVGKDNQIISLSDLTKWLAERAEEKDIDILCDFPAEYGIIDSSNKFRGAVTKDKGIGKDNERTENFEPGMTILAKQTILAEGCRGSVSETVMDHQDLRKEDKVDRFVQNQSQAIGLKEVWHVEDKNSQPGKVLHSVGFPSKSDLQSGGFLYHSENKVQLGFVVGLDQQQGNINPYELFQTWKTHPDIRKHVEGGKCIGYGARALNSGGFHSIPQTVFEGGMMVGCSAGFVNNMKIKGSHNAIKSGILAADNIYSKFKSKNSDIEQLGGVAIHEYQDSLKYSDIFDELQRVRNFKGGFKKFGNKLGLVHGGLLGHITKGKEWWTIKYKGNDAFKLKETKTSEPSTFKPDGVLTFDLLENLSRSNTYHNADQPPHLIMKSEQKTHTNKSSKQDFPESQFCPANVQEQVEDQNGEKMLQINAQNCLHCKTCSIKMPNENVFWNTPEGGGPSYEGM